jgi:anionic cell wall polymer biosynthesis LytR-Cps2A-Psr (LCP) family protein
MMKMPTMMMTTTTVTMVSILSSLTFSIQYHFSHYLTCATLSDDGEASDNIYLQNFKDEYTNALMASDDDAGDDDDDEGDDDDDDEGDEELGTSARE